MTWVWVGVVWCFTVFGLMVYRPTRRWVGSQFIKFVLKKDEEYGDIIFVTRQRLQDSEVNPE